MHGQMGYPYPPMAYQSDPEHASPQALSHGPQSNFGILGDPIDSKNKRRRGNLPKPTTEILKKWFHEHLDHPYPSEEDKQMFMTRTNLTISQVFQITQPCVIFFFFLFWIGLTSTRSAIGSSTRGDANSLPCGIKCERVEAKQIKDSLL